MLGDATLDLIRQFASLDQAELGAVHLDCDTVAWLNLDVAGNAKVTTLELLHGGVMELCGELPLTVVHSDHGSFLVLAQDFSNRLSLECL